MTNTVKATRLTEADVHAACDQILAKGEEPTALKLLNHVGHGGLGTFTKYLNSWKELHKDKQAEIAALPKTVSLPDRYVKEAEEFNKRVWHLAKIICDEEITVEREHLRQTEKEIQQKLEDSIAFSEVQSTRYDDLNAEFDGLGEQLKALTVQHVELQKTHNLAESKNSDLQTELSDTAEQVNKLAEIVANLEQKLALADQEKQQLNTAIAERDETLINVKGEHAKTLEKLEFKHIAEIDRLAKAHDQTLVEIKIAHTRTIDESERVHQKMVEQLQNMIDGLTKDKQSLDEQLKNLTGELKKLSAKDNGKKE